MKINYDYEVDALYIELLSLAPGTAENRELTEDIIADRSPDGQLALVRNTQRFAGSGRSPKRGYSSKHSAISSQPYARSAGNAIRLRSGEPLRASIAVSSFGLP